MSADGQRLLVYAGQTALLVQASTGLRLSAPFDPRMLVLRKARVARVASEAAETDAAREPLIPPRRPNSLMTAPLTSWPAAVRIGAPLTANAALALLPSLDQRTLLSNGRTPLDGMP